MHFKLSPISLAAAITSLLITIVSHSDTSDSLHEWVVLKGGWEGIDVARPTYQIAEDLGIAGRFSTKTVARPPGFFVLYVPTLPDPAIAGVAVAVFNMAAVVVLIGRRSTWEGELVVAAILVGLAFPGLLSNDSALIWSALIALTWFNIDRDWKWGIPLGIAAAVRFWPALPIVWLLSRRKATGFGAAGTAGVLTLAGLTSFRCHRPRR
jgi:hypothetical protein